MNAKAPPKPPPPPVVSVIVVNFNGGELTPACLESIPPGVETIVVDNGSTDGSADAIATRFPQVLLVRAGANRGFAGGVNLGLEVARGRYVCLLNNDARLSPGALDALVAHLDAHPDVGMAAPQLLHEDGRRQHSFDNFPSLATVFLNKSLLRLLRPSKYPSKRQVFAEPRDVESVIGACMIVRRSLIDRIGPLDEAYFLFLEETDWCLKARRSGARVVFVPQATVVHLQGRTRDKVRVRARIEYTRSLFTYFRKNRPASYLPLRILFPVRTLVALLAQTLTLFLKGAPRRWSETAAVLGWQIAGCPPAWGLSTAGETKALRLRDGWTVLEPHMDGFGRFDDLVAKGKVVRDEAGKRHVEVAVGERAYLVKIYKGTSLVKKAVGSKAAREFAVSREIVRAGIPCAPIVAWGDRAYGSAAVVEKVCGAATLQDVLLSDPARRRRLAFLYGRFARRLQDAGVYQYDFNPTNVLAVGERLLLIDFERAAYRGRPLAESERLELVAKIDRIPVLSRADRLRFVKGYVDAHEADRRRLKEIVRELKRRSEAKKASDAGKTERRSVEENGAFGAFAIADLEGHYRKDAVSADALPALLEKGRREEVEDAVAAWQAANRAAGPRPAAVVRRKGERRGALVYALGGTEGPANG